MSTSWFSRSQDHLPEPASPEKSLSFEEEAVDFLLRLDEEDTRQTGPELDARSNTGRENEGPQLWSEKGAEKRVPQKAPTIRPSEVARLLLKQAAFMKRRS
jgi:hypothetical protein